MVDLREEVAAPTKWSAMSDDRRVDVLDWLVDTCLLWGTTRSTAYKVASEFARGLDG